MNNTTDTTRGTGTTNPPEQHKLTRCLVGFFWLNL